jgi:hypothetical protein
MAAAAIRNLTHLGIDINMLEVSGDDPGLVVVYGNAPGVHQCLGLVGSPVLQGMTPDVSLLNLRAWVRQSIVAAVGAGCQVPVAVGGYSDALFHHMSAGDVMRAQAALFNGPWNAALAAAGATCGSMLLITSGGSGLNQAEQVPSPLCGPFVG